MGFVEYKVHSALAEDSNEGRIWIKHKDLEEKIRGKRRIVCIKGENAKRIYGEALFADGFYLDKWKKLYREKGWSDPEFGDDVIFLSAWYRHLLGIKAEYFPVPKKLDVKPLDPLNPLNLWTLLYRYPRTHPQALVLATSMMGIIGFGLGGIGFGLGLVGVHDWLEKHFSTSFTNFSDPIGIVVFVIGFLITLLGIRGLIRS